MNIMILGIDGYLGWPLALHLLNRGHKVSGLDSYVRRARVEKVNSNSLTPIASNPDREDIFYNQGGTDLDFHHLGEGDYYSLRRILIDNEPDVIVHLAEQPSAPWSMVDVYNTSITQQENIIGTLELLWAMYEVCPKAHLVKLGTMGEYGTPNCDIPEGEIPKDCLDPINHFISHDCPMSGLQFPRAAGSFYHLSKVHDTHNIIFACKNWGLSSTDIMQGVVFGVKTPEMTDDSMITRLDYNEYFGTVINRFCAQALISHPLTIYGDGGQTRGYLPIEDSMICITLAIENPPTRGEYRVFNQFEQIYSIVELAAIVQIAGDTHGLDVKIKHYENPRKEMESHYYNPYRQKLLDLGYEPTTDIEHVVTKFIGDILPYAGRVKKENLIPHTRWDSKHRDSKII